MKYISCLLFVALISCQISVYADGEKEIKPKQGVVTGTVTDKATGEILIGVKVCIEGSNKSVYTDFEGNFTIKNIESGQYIICTSYTSYKNKFLALDIDTNTPKTIALALEQK